MIKGVTQKEEEIIKNILRQFPYKFYCYGSRVKGDFTKSSDLDVLLKHNETVEPKILNKLDEEFNKSTIPYKVNISEYINMDKDFDTLIETNLAEI